MTKTALVTGSRGFIGRHMVTELKRRGFSVWQVDLGYGWWSFLHPDQQPYEGHTSEDMVSELAWLERVKKTFDLVVHCAYHVGGRAAIDGTNTNFAKNLMLDSAMFEWAVRTKQKRVLYFSSSAAYPVLLQSKEYVEYNGPIQLREDDMYVGPAKPGGYDMVGIPDAAYGWAKLTGERLAEDARRNGLAVSVVRPFSGYGEDQSLDYPFPSIVRRASAGDLSVWGPPGQCRDWLHVDDVVRGALAVVESETELAVNLCSGRATEMGELAKMVFRFGCGDSCDYRNHDLDEALYLEDKPTGVFYRVGDPTRMLKYYTPKVSLEEGIRRALQT